MAQSIVHPASTIDEIPSSATPFFKRLWVKVVITLLFVGLASFSLLELASFVRVPQLKPLSRVATLPHDAKLDKHHVDQRLILVGDVHGMYDELQELLDKVDYNRKKDTLVFLGDMITKGYDSLGVVDFAIKHNAYCVRGNHEDEILSLYAEKHNLEMPKTFPPYASAATMTAFDEPEATLQATQGPDLREKTQPTAAPEAPIDSIDRISKRGAHDDIVNVVADIVDDITDGVADIADEIADFVDDIVDDITSAAGNEREHTDSDKLSGMSSNPDVKEDKQRDGPLVKSLKPHHIAYLQACPAILELGQVSKRGIEAVAVHGGLLWHEPELEKQDIADVLRIRSIVPPEYTKGSEDPDDGEPWFPRWNEEQRLRPKNQRFEVFYGHDASKGLQLHRYSKGLDTKCQRGGRLSAYVVRVHHDGHFREDLVDIKC